MDQVQGVISVAGRRQVLKPEECYSGFKCAVKEEDGLGCEAGENCVCLQFAAHSKNESFARMVAAAYVAQLNPTLEELADIKTAVSEAVTNAVIHGYGDGDGVICMRFDIAGSEICIEVEDWGMGIADIMAAMEPMYTTRPDMERSGMGFAFMEAFMDELEVHSLKNCGTFVRMRKKIGGGASALEGESPA